MMYIDVCNLHKKHEKVGIYKTKLWDGPPRNNEPKSQYIVAPLKKTLIT